MTLILFFAIGMAAGWLVPRMMSGDGYGPAVDFAVAVGGAVVAGFIFNAAMGGWMPGAIAAMLFAIACTFGTRQVKNMRDKEQAAVLAREAARRRLARSR